MSSFTVKPVKFSFNGDIRRVRLDDAATRSFATFMSFVKATFPVLASVSVSPTVQYEDDEAELITIGSDAELSEAFRLAATDGRPSLRFIIGALPAGTDAVKRAKTDDVAESPAAPPAVAPAPPAPVRRGQGVPVPKLLALVDLLRQEYRGNPLPLLSAAMGLLSDPAAAGAVARLLPLISDIPALLEAVARDPVLRLVLSQPPVLPFLAAVDIELDDCVVGEPAAPAPAGSALDASTFLPSLLQQFAGLGFGVPCAPASSRSDVGVTAASVDELPVHRLVTCDGCGMSPIIGSRFKCDVCPDFDLCGRCFGRPDAHPHACTLIEQPVGYEPSPAGTLLGGKPVHIGVTCDGCNLNPIVGARFKCTVCTNYDLCESCEAADVHPSHPLLKIRDASQTPAKLIAVLRPEQLPAEPVHATVDEAGCRKFWGGRWRGRGGGCRGRKHERTWGGRGPQASESPSREDAALQAAIQASLEQPAPVESVAAPPAPKAAVPVVFVKPEVDEFSARFVSHVTLTDATPLVPGSTVVKTWRMKNEGATAWLSGTRLVHVGAETLGCPAEGVSVPAVAPGESVDISIALVAPSIPGRHVGYFRLVTPAGVRFGHRIWADIFVENSNVASVIGSLVPPPAVKPAVEPAPSKPVVESAPSKPVVVSAPPSFPLLPTPSAPVDVAPAVLPVLPSPPVVPDVPAKWETQLLQMAEMGFYNIEANVRALEAFGGNVTRAVDSLLQ